MTPKEEISATKPRRLIRFSIRILLLFISLISCVFAYVGFQLNQEIDAPIFWDDAKGTNIKWTARLGSQTYSNPTLSDKYVFVGSNNGAGYNPQFPPTVDLGVMLCFEKRTGEFVWQHANPKLATGRVNDWPLQGVTSSAYAEGNRLWYVSNRCEVVCLDADGFRDGQNDGPFVREVLNGPSDADVVWKYDMIGELNVFPHNISHCNVEVDSERVYVKTSNGVDESHANLPSPDAPSFLVLDRETGEVVWHDNTPGRSIMHGSWGSPRLATLNGTRQILFPGGDGWLYSYIPEGDGNGNPVLLWKYDCNPKTSTYQLGGRGNRNNLLTEPTVYENRIYVTLGQDPEHGEGESRVLCIEPNNRRGDLSPTLVEKGQPHSTPTIENGFRHCLPENGDREIPNPDSAKVWEYIGVDQNKNGTIDKGEPAMHRSLSRVTIGNDCIFVSDMFGYLHCLDLATGDARWVADQLSSVWSTPTIVGDFVFCTTEDGEVKIHRANADPASAKPIATIENANYSSYYANFVVENGVIYFATRNQMIVVEDPNAKNAFQRMFAR